MEKANIELSSNRIVMNMLEDPFTFISAPKNGLKRSRSSCKSHSCPRGTRLVNGLLLVVSTQTNAN